MNRSEHEGGHPLRETVIDQLQKVHALKSGALRMFGPMLAEVQRQREEQALPEVQDLLEKMASAFGGHEATTREHERRVKARLRALGAGLSKPRQVGLALAGTLRARLGRIGGQNHGTGARDAFVFEHLEIASWELLEHLAERIGDTDTAELARECRADDDEMAALIRRNFPNALSLMLAGEGLPTFREAEQSEDAKGQQAEVPAEGAGGEPEGESEAEKPGVGVREAARLRAEREVVVLDVRDQEEWDAGHIPGALWIPTDEISDRRGELPTTRRIITICRSGKRSAQAAKQLREEGYEADNVEGGMQAWHAAGLPIEPPDGRVA